LVIASDEQYESIPDDEIALQARKFHAFHKFRKERRRSPRGCFECGDTTHFIADCSKRKKLDNSNKYDYTKRNDYSKGDDKKKHRLGDKKKKKFQKIMSQVCATLSDFDFLVMTPPAQRMMRRSSTSMATSPTFASRANL
jgi:hypothetical protein